MYVTVTNYYSALSKITNNYKEITDLHTPDSKCGEIVCLNMAFRCHK